MILQYNIKPDYICGNTKITINATKTSQYYLISGKNQHGVTITKYEYINPNYKSFYEKEYNALNQKEHFTVLQTFQKQK